MKNLTLKELAEKLNGKYWGKGDKQRVYLDRGHNTKKMKTNTYVYQREDGEFCVSVYIDCPSQPYQWIESQKDKIIENVEEEIQKVFRDIEFDAADELFVVYNPSAGEGSYYSRYNESKFNDLGDLDEDEDVFLTEKGAEQVIKLHDLSNYWTVISVKKSLYKERCQMRLAEIRLEREQKQEDAQIKAAASRKQKAKQEKEFRDKSTDAAKSVRIKFEKFLHDTGKAFLVRINGVEHWIPKKLCRNLIVNNKLGGNVCVPTFIVERIGLNIEDCSPDIEVIHHIPEAQDKSNIKHDADLFR